MLIRKFSPFILTLAGFSLYAGVALAHSTSAQRSPNDPLRSLLFVHQFAQVSISPNGKKVAWVEMVIDKQGSPTGHQDIFVKHSTRFKAQRISGGPANSHSDESSITWSPNSLQFAFLSDAAKKGQQQLYILSEVGRPARKITNVKGLLSSPKWSPDGKSIAVLYTENYTGTAGPTSAQKAQTGVIKDVVFEQRLAIINIAHKSLRQITPPDTYVYEYDWAPDAKSLVFTAAKGNGDSNWYIAQLYAIDSATKALRAIYQPPLQIGRPVVSPDGKNVAFISGLNSDESIVSGDVFVVPLAGGVARNLSENRKATASSIFWSSDGKIIDIENVDGESSIVRIDPLNNKIESLYQTPALITNGQWTPSIAISSDGKTAAFQRSSFAQPPEIWAGPMGQWQQLTHHNNHLKPAWGEAKSLHWQNKGFTLQGWLIYPQNFDPTKKYPMIVSPHGGPSYGIQPKWPNAHSYMMALPAKGYFLFMPNPRGSFGNGQSFTQANVRDFGYGDWQDIMSGIDEVLRVAPIDPDRLGLTGWSYGGYMTMWGITQTNRFRAAVAGAGVANWISYCGQNAIQEFMRPFFTKTPYEDPEIYARSSPITFIKNAKTPTLIIVGDSDGECPPPQSYEFWRALKTLGVETELVVYENEGHAFLNPDHVRDVINRTTAWFDAHL
jgi:dipeptidyl aminopeptidase/acylaminoacyl peptidase